MPKELKAEIEKIAEAEQRSVNKTIILLLWQAIEDYGDGGSALLSAGGSPPDSLGATKTIKLSRLTPRKKKAQDKRA